MWCDGAYSTIVSKHIRRQVPCFYMIKMDYGSWLKVNTILHFFFYFLLSHFCRTGWTRCIAIYRRLSKAPCNQWGRSSKSSHGLGPWSKARWLGNHRLERSSIGAEAPRILQGQIDGTDCGAAERLTFRCAPGNMTLQNRNPHLNSENLSGYFPTHRTKMMPIGSYTTPLKCICSSNAGSNRLGGTLCALPCGCLAAQGSSRMLVGLHQDAVRSPHTWSESNDLITIQNPE